MFHIINFTSKFSIRFSYSIETKITRTDENNVIRHFRVFEIFVRFFQNYREIRLIWLKLLFR